MTPARAVAALLIAIALLSIANQAVDTWMDPGPRRWEADSYSGAPSGYRALYEVMEALGHDVSRWEAPPLELFQGDRRVLFLSPELFQLEVEKRYLKDMGEWLQQGGEVVLASPTLSLRRRMEFEDEEYESEAFPGENNGDGGENGEDAEEAAPEPEREDTLWDILGEEMLREALGLGELAVTSRNAGRVPDRLPPTPWGGPQFLEGMRYDLLAFYRWPEMEYRIAAEGALEAYVDDLTALWLPEGLRYLEGPELEQAEGVLYVTPLEDADDEGKRYPIAAQFAQGAGRALVVAEPVLFSNESMAKDAGNAVAAYRLALGDGARQVIIDEYYHGVVPRGNMFALFGVHPYGAIAAAIAAATALVIWGASVRFGPASPPREGERRAIGEYVEAMANLFERGAKHRFVLETCRAGVLDEIREALLLPHGVNESVVLGRLARVDAQRAQALHEALEASKHVLRSGREPSLATVHELQEKLEACRLPHRKAPQTADPISRRFMSAR